MSESSDKPLLEGVKVLDLSQYVPGPFATRQLADLGANVIKVEPLTGDPMRRFMFGDEGMSPIYRHLNRGKRICRLDLKSTQGEQALATLLTDADVLLESYRPGMLDRLGFGSDRLQQINSRLIHCALSGYGQTGPYRNRAGHDVNYLASAGILATNGIEERPVLTYPPLADHAGAMQASTAILAALYSREKNQQGVFLDISLFESAMAWNYLPILDQHESREKSILNGGVACYNIYRCADGSFVSLGALEKHFWSNFCHAVDQENWINRQQESMPQKQLTRELSLLFASQPLSHWNQLLTTVDCCYEPVLDASELSLHPQVKARELLDEKGPRYAGKVDGKTPAFGDELIEFSVAELPHW